MGEFGTDYAFLSEHETRAEAQGVAFEGTAGCVQDRKSGIVLSLGAEGKVKYGQVRVACDGAVSVRLRDAKHIEVMLPPEHTGTSVELKLPGDYKWTQSELDAKSTRQGRLYTLVTPQGLTSVVLVAQ